MSTTQSIKKQPSPTDRVHTRHHVLGVDSEGRTHHWDKAFGRDYITEAGARIYVVGDGLEHVEELGTRSVTEWAAYVNAECGWKSCTLINVRPAFVQLKTEEIR